MAEPQQEKHVDKPSAPKSIGHYVLLKTIGTGTFGKVKLGQHILTGEIVAVKILEKDRMVDVSEIKRVAREIHILKLIRHPHIIQLYEIIETPRQLYLIMEYASGGELFEYIVSHGRVNELEACRFLHQILAGVECVHATYVAHRDLKPENLLLDSRKDIKIADFGLSNTYSEGQLLQTSCGSPCYAAPEMINGQPYVPCLADIWSVGVILFALVCGYLPFHDQNQPELYNKILKAEYELPDSIGSDVANLIAAILAINPQQRLLLDEIRNHEWYRQIPEASLQPIHSPGALDEEILAQLDSYGFPRDHAIKCLESNKHNHVTTTYYLLKEKRLRAGSQGKDPSVDTIISDLDAAFHDEEAPLSSSSPTLPSAALVCPSAGVKRLHPSAGVKRLSHGAVSNHSRPPVPRMLLGEALQQYGISDVTPTSMTCREPYCRVPSTEVQGHGSARPPVKMHSKCPSVDIQDYGMNGTVPSSMTARPSPRPHSRATSIDMRVREVLQPPSASGPSSSPRLRAPTPRRRSSRKGSDVGLTHNAWNDSPRYHEPRPLWVPFNMPGEFRSSSARRRLNGGRGGNKRDLSLPSSTRSVPGRPYSARGSHDKAESLMDMPQESHNTLHVPLGSSRLPRQIFQEVLHALATHEVNCRQVSEFLIRCQCWGVRFEVEIFQYDGGGYVLRFLCVSGDVWKYKEMCAHLVSDMHL